MALAALLVLAGLALRTILPLNPDLVWLAHLARTHLAGIEVYRQFVELNPPLAWWIYLPAAAAAESVGIPLSAAVHLETICLVMALGAVAVMLTPRPSRARVLPWIAFAGMVVPGVQFGQRDHLVGLLFIPAAVDLVAAENTETRPSWHDVVLGVLLGLACSLKPHYLPAALFLVASRASSAESPGSGWRWSALTAMALVGSLLAAAVFALEPDYLRVVKDFGALYAAWHRATPLDFFKPVSLLALAGSLALAGQKGGGRIIALISLLLVGAIIQDKGFTYHFLPAASVTIVLVPLVLGPDRGWRLFPVALVALASAWLLTVAGARQVRNRRSSAEQALRSVGPGTSVLILTHVVGSSWPSVIDHGWTWTSSFASSWWLESIISHHGGKWCADGQVRDDDLTADERRALDRAIADILVTKPEVILTYRPIRGPDGACVMEKRWNDWDDVVRSYQVGALDVFATDRCVAMLLGGYDGSAGPDRTWPVVLRRGELPNLPPECNLGNQLESHPTRTHRQISPRLARLPYMSMPVR